MSESSSAASSPAEDTHHLGGDDGHHLRPRTPSTSFDASPMISPSQPSVLDVSGSGAGVVSSSSASSSAQSHSQHMNGGAGLHTPHYTPSGSSSQPHHAPHPSQGSLLHLHSSPSVSMSERGDSDVDDFSLPGQQQQQQQHRHNAPTSSQTPPSLRSPSAASSLQHRRSLTELPISESAGGGGGGGRTRTMVSPTPSRASAIAQSPTPAGVSRSLPYEQRLCGNLFGEQKQFDPDPDPRMVHVYVRPERGNGAPELKHSVALKDFGSIGELKRILTHKAKEKHELSHPDQWLRSAMYFLDSTVELRDDLPNVVLTHELLRDRYQNELEQRRLGEANGTAVGANAGAGAGTQGRSAVFPDSKLLDPFDERAEDGMTTDEEEYEVDDGEDSEYNSEAERELPIVKLEAIQYPPKRTKPVLKGYLSKRSGAFRRWRRRHFHLHSGRLEYRKSETNSKHSKVIPLGQRLEIRRNTRHPSEFVIETSNKLYRLRASSEEEMFQWVSDIDILLTVQSEDSSAKVDVNKRYKRSAKHCAKCKKGFGIMKRKYVCLKCKLVFCKRCFSRAESLCVDHCEAVPELVAAEEAGNHEWDVVGPEDDSDDDLDSYFYESKLVVQVKEAHDLFPSDNNGKSDPYCVVFFETQERRTEVIRETLHPVWNAEPFTFKPTGRSNLLTVTVWDWDRLSRDDFIGMVQIPLYALTPGEWYDGWYRLYRRPGKKGLNDEVSGSIHLRLHYVRPASALFCALADVPAEEVDADRSSAEHTDSAAPTPLKGSSFAGDTDGRVHYLRDKTQSAVDLQSAKERNAIESANARATGELRGTTGITERVSKGHLRRGFKRLGALYESMRVDSMRGSIKRVLEWDNPPVTLLCLVLYVYIVLVTPVWMIPPLVPMAALFLMATSYIENKYFGRNGIVEGGNCPPPWLLEEMQKKGGAAYDRVRSQLLMRSMTHLDLLEDIDSSDDDEGVELAARIRSADMHDMYDDRDPEPARRQATGLLITVLGEKTYRDVLKVQITLDTVCTFAEQVQGLFSWRDPQQSRVFAQILGVLLLILLILPFRLILLLVGVQRFLAHLIKRGKFMKRFRKMTKNHALQVLATQSGDNPVDNFLRRTPMPWAYESSARLVPKKIWGRVSANEGAKKKKLTKRRKMRPRKPENRAPE